MFDPEKLATIKTVVEIISIIIGIVGALGGGLYAFLKMRQSNVDVLVQNSTMDDDAKASVLHALKLWRYGAIAMGVILAATSITLLVFNLLPGPDQGAMSRYLARHDPKLFRHAGSNGLYDFARVIPNRESLQSETNLSETLQETKHTFDFVAVHGLSILQNYENEVTAGLKRGVAYRVILWDPSDANRMSFDLMAEILGHTGEMQRHRVEESLTLIRKLRMRVAADRETYRGSLEVRCLSKPVLFSMWIKDRNDPEGAMAHITVPQYRGASDNPSFRLSNKACKRTLDGFKSEFEEMWARAKVPQR